MIRRAGDEHRVRTAASKVKKAAASPPRQILGRAKTIQANTGGKFWPAGNSNRTAAILWASTLATGVQLALAAPLNYPLMTAGSFKMLPSPSPAPTVVYHSCVSFRKSTSPAGDGADGGDAPDTLVFPMNASQRRRLFASGSDLVSPFIDSDPQLIGGTCADVMQSAGVLPPQPLGHVSNAMWDEFELVTKYQLQRAAQAVRTASGTCPDGARLTRPACRALAKTERLVFGGSRLCVGDNECPEGCYFEAGKVYWNKGIAGRCSEARQCFCGYTQDWAREIMELPKLFKGYTMAQAADAVEKDFPTYWPTQIIEQLFRERADMDWTVVPRLTAGEFVNKQVLLSRVAGWAVQTASPTVFSCKHTYGRARPEELAYAAQQGNACAPTDGVRDLLDQLPPLETGSDGVGASGYTAYGTGSPRHPSWPAMHSAASSASTYLPALMSLTDAQIAEVRKLDYAVATSRSIAGVHYPSDNIAGLMLGQQIVSDQLPGFLGQLGFSEAQVEEAKVKLAAQKFSWTEWESRGCHLDSGHSENGSNAMQATACKCPGCPADPYTL